MKKKKRKRLKHSESITKEDLVTATNAIGRTPYNIKSLFGKKKK